MLTNFEALQKCKILIVGSSGQVGSSFLRKLSQWPLTRFTSRKTNFTNIFHMDLEDATAIENVVREFKPEFIVNCAAYTAVDQAESDRSGALQINRSAVEVLAKLSQEIGAHFIHYSTDYVYPGTGASEFVETDLTSPVNYYGETKLLGEQAALKYCSKTYIFRTQWVYAKEGKNFVNTMLRLGKERPELSIVGDQIGSPTSAEFISEMTLKAMLKISMSSFEPGIYHMACRGQISWYEFAQEIFRLGRIRGDELKVTQINRITSEAFPSPAVRPKNSRLSLAKLELALGEQMHRWQDCLKANFL